MPKRTNDKIKSYVLKNGQKKFYFQIYLGKNSSGKKIITTRRGFKSYAEAETAYNQLSQIKADNFIKQKQIIVRELYNLWFENYRHQVKESTANKTNTNYRVHIDPVFGENFIDQIRVKDLQIWVDNLSKKLVKYRDPVGIMKAIFEYGMRLGYISDNSINKIIVPKKSSRKRRDIENNVYNQQELDHFLNVAKQVNNRVYLYFKLLSGTGMRKGEALALTWNDIDLINDTIQINKTLSYGMNNRLIVSSPKTKTSTRTIPLPESLKLLLLEYRRSEKILSDKIFHTINGHYLSLSKPAQWLNQVYTKDHEINVSFAQENKLDDNYVLNKDLKKITIHGFRHTFATLLIENTNVKPKTVQMLLGHANIEMTLDIYTHINERNQVDAINAMNKLDNGIKKAW